MRFTSALPKFQFTLISALLFAFLFHDYDWGLNLFIFQIFWLVAASWRKIRSMTNTQQWIGLGAFLAIVFTFLQHTYLGFYVSFLCVMMFSLSMAFSDLRSFHFIFLNFITSALGSFIEFGNIEGTGQSRFGMRMKALKGYLKFLIPIGVLLVFFNLYAAGNPTFGALADYSMDKLDHFFIWMSHHIKWTLLWFFLLGLSISIPFFYPVLVPHFAKRDQEDFGMLLRKRVKEIAPNFKMTALKDEVKLGQFLMIGLNLMLGLLLVFEVKDVWFGFSWDGQYLKDFVHQGMHILTIAILISMVVALFFFRKNLNFYKKSAQLKNLTYLWLFLNGILVVSVAVRDFWYIHHFALAYMRIALLFFLAATLIGLVSIYLKIKHTRNVLYLLRVNSISIYFLLIFSTFFNWDRMIAMYNFSNAERAFVHLDYLSSLSDSALPYLTASGIDLEKIEVEQRNRLGESSMSYNSKYITANNYQQLINLKTDKFYYDWPRRSWLEWNVSEWWAHRQLKPSMEGDL